VPLRALKPGQHRPGVEQEGDEHRHRIARQAEEHAVADLAHASGRPGLTAICQACSVPNSWMVETM
jgi:hypothetical protein